jgi:hypothetical protein
MVPYDSETAPEWHISGRLLLFTAPRGERWALGLAEVKSVRILEVDAPSV